MLTAIADRLLAISSQPPWGRTLGFARTLAALGILLTLIFTPLQFLFVPSQGTAARFCNGIAGAGLFCIFPEDQLWAPCAIAIAVLLSVVVGYRPRWTALPFAWVVFSFTTAVTIKDGGDQIAQNLALLLVPLGLTDSRRWHWTEHAEDMRTPRVKTLIAWSTIFVIWLQAVVLYGNAALGKIAVNEWDDGTALYYWVNEYTFGASGLRHTVISAIVGTPVGVAALTWGTIALEVALCVAILVPRRVKFVLLWLGIAFHLGIAVFLGLISFAFPMFALLVLYLADIRLPFPRSVGLRASVLAASSRSIADAEV